MTIAEGELEPIERESTASVIADRLRQAIAAGTFAPGTQLGETDLARRFGVSRGPLREAMQRLVQEGLLDSIRHRGLFVTALTADDVRDIYASRTAIESAAVALILDQDPARSAARLAKTQARMAAAARRGDTGALSSADMSFHEVLVSESGSVRLERMARTLFVETRMCINALQDKYTAPAELADEHAAIVDAIRDADRERALRLVEAHMQDAVDRLAPATDGGSR